MLHRDVLARDLGTLLQNEIDQQRLAGVSIAVAYRGARVLTLQFGVDKPDTIYHIFSMTKPITAVAIGILYERGLIDLWQPVSDFLPAFSHMQVATPNGSTPAQKPITLQMLLNMTSGIVYPEAQGSAAETAMFALQAQLTKEALSDESFSTVRGANALAAAPLLFEPGTAFHYGASADVLGGVIEVVTGMTPQAFMQQYIFEPLGMRDTAFLVDESKLPRLSDMYARTGGLHRTDDRVLQTMVLNSYATKGRFLPCGAGLYATLDDYMRFADMLLHDGTVGGVRILGRKTVQYLRTSQMTPEIRRTFDMTGQDGYDYSNFFRILTDCAQARSNGSTGEYGWDGLPGCYFMVDPAEQLTMCYMQQIVEGHDWTLRRRIRQILYANLD